MTRAKTGPGTAKAQSSPAEPRNPAVRFIFVRDPGRLVAGGSDLRMLEAGERLCPQTLITPTHVPVICGDWCALYCDATTIDSPNACAFMVIAANMIAAGLLAGPATDPLVDLAGLIIAGERPLGDCR